MSVGPSASYTLQRIQDLLAQGLSFEDALEKVNPVISIRRRLLRRLAFVRQFDRRLYDVAARTTPNAASMYEEIVQTPGIEAVTPFAVAAEPAIYRVKDGFAAELLKEWLDKEKDAQPAIRRLARDVWDYLATEKRGTPLDLLRYRIAKADANSVSEQEEVLGEFNAAFEQADSAKLDLAECHALVRMLIELDNVSVGQVSAPLRLLSPALRARCDQLLPYVAIRGRFIQEYAKSATYQQRDALWNGAVSDAGARTMGVEAYLGQAGRGLLSIYGTGGRGKTIFLNWLISRYCVQPPVQIAVGRVDFDDINVAKLENRPELLLFPLAEQLSRQLPALQDFVDRWGRYAAILTPASRVPRGVNIDGLEKQLDSEGRADVLIDTFALKLPAARFTLILLDTLEEAVLHHPKALHNVVALCHRLQRAQEKAQTLRVMLSGRYNLRQRGFLDPADPEPIEIGPFDRGECVTYLRITREWEKQQRHLELVDAIAAKNAGNPFILSLVADLVERGSIATLDDVRTLKPEFSYLIDRVIKRIPDAHRGVRWVIRYGVVPYRLTPEFLRDVMAPHLRRELAASEGEQDKLSQYGEYFPRGGELNVDTLWSDLSGYASDYGWVKATADEIRFQPEVVVPMAALLSSEPIFKQLHADAERHYRSKAEDANAPWPSLMAEVVFHLAHLREPRLEQTFLDLLADPRAQPPAARREILDAITRSSFVDEEGRPRLHNPPEEASTDKERTAQPPVREPIVPARLIGLAYLELARLGAGVHFGECDLIETESTVRKWLDLSKELLGTSDSRADVVVRMSLEASDRRFAEVLKLGEALTTSRLQESERFAWHVLMSRAYLARGEDGAFDQAIRHLDAADQLVPAGHPAKLKVADEKASALKAAGRYEETILAYNQLLAVAAPDRQVAYKSELAELYLDSGELAKAIDVMPVPDVPPPVGTREGRRLARTCVLAQVDQRRALAPASQADDPTEPETLEARGALLVSKYQLKKGIELLERAVVRYRDRGDAVPGAKATLRLLRARIDLSGDLARAERFVPDRDQFERSVGPSILVEAAFLRRAGRLAASTELNLAPWSTAAIRLIQAGAADADAPLAAFAEALEAIEPPARRYDMLRFFKWIEPLRSGAAPRIVACVPVPEPDHPDYLPRALSVVGCLRALGERREAQRLLQRTFRFERGRRHTAGREMILAALSTESDLPDLDALGQPQDELDIAVRVAYVHGLLQRGREDEAAAMQANLPAVLSPELTRSLIEATHLKNLAQLTESRRRANALRARSEDVRRQLGQEAAAPPSSPTVLAPPVPESPRQDARESTPPSSPTPLEAPMAVTKSSVVVSLASLTDPSSPLPTRDLVPFEQLKLLVDAEDEVGRRLSASLALPANLPRDAEVRLIADGGQAGLLPWEWAARDAFCYRATTVEKGTRSFGDVVWSLMPEKLRRTVRLASPLRAAVVQRAISQQERSRRGFERTSRRTLVDIYKSHALSATMAASNRAALADILRELPQVIHLQLPIVERYRRLCAAFGDDDGNELSVESLLLSWPSDPFWHPLVILDPPRPTDDLEIARQLLLRNGFALELFATGRPRGVLATGLFEEEFAELSAERLAHALSGNPSMRHVLRFVQRELGGDRFARGAALFVDNPERSIA